MKVSLVELIFNQIMKKSLLLLSITLLSITSSFAQKTDNKEISKEANDALVESNTYNKWTIEVSAGQSKGIKPFAPGYFSSDPSYLGGFKFNNWNAGVRYMFSPKFGIKLDFSSDSFKNLNGTASLPFKTQQYRVSFQGVINAARLFDIQKELGRFNFLIHGGLQVAQRTPKTLTSPAYNDPEGDGGLIFGVSPEFRIFKSFSIIADYSMLVNYRQHYTWDGNVADPSLNLNGQMSNLSIGLTYSFGSAKLHGDYAIIKTDEMIALAALDKKVGDIESMMNDVDKDGVPDYLDEENNSIAGVAVNTKGRMIDLNKNGVADELEKYMSDTYIDKSNVSSTIETANSEMIKKLINEGYVAAYYDFNSATPTDASSQGIGFILNYLRTNPTASVDIFGHADEIGKSKVNQKLADNRANVVKNTLIKAGIDASRLNVVPGSIDNSVDPKSSQARRLVRKVTFNIKD